MTEICGTAPNALAVAAAAAAASRCEHADAGLVLEPPPSATPESGLLSTAAAAAEVRSLTSALSLAALV